MGAVPSTVGSKGSQQTVRTWFPARKKVASKKSSSSSPDVAESPLSKVQAETPASKNLVEAHPAAPAPLSKVQAEIPASNKLVEAHPAPVTSPPEVVSNDDVEYVVKKTHEFQEELPNGFKELDAILRHEKIDNILGQKGPTCAAASVANALNVVFKHDRADENAFKVSDVMQVYFFICEKNRAEAVNKLSKLVKTDASCLMRYLATEEVCLAAKSRNKEKIVSVLLDSLPSGPSEDSDPNTEQALGAVRHALENADQPKSALVLDRIRRVAKAEWAVAKLEGRWKLPSGKTVPSTAPIGNLNLGVACKSLALLREKKEVRVTSFMGLDKKKCRHVVSKEDSQEDRGRHWEEMKAVLENREAAVIFHLHNHYALIAGWREVEAQTSTGASLRRQVLTARNGQAPMHWVDWEGDHHAFSKKGQEYIRKSVRSTLLSWKGHAIMLIEPVRFASKKQKVDVDVHAVVEGVSLEGVAADEDEADDGADEDPEAADMAGASSGDEA